MTKPNIIVPDLPDLPPGYGPDVVFGPQQDRPHVWWDGYEWQASDVEFDDHMWHAYKREPVKRVVYMNVYPNDCHLNDSRERADARALGGRIGCNRIELEEGRWDD